MKDNDLKEEYLLHFIFITAFVIMLLNIIIRQTIDKIIFVNIVSKSDG